MKIDFNRLKDEINGLKLYFNKINYIFKEYYKGKIDLCENKSKKILNRIGRKQFLFIYRHSKIIIPKLTTWTFRVLLSGGAIFIATTSIYSPISLLHQIFGYGLGLYIISKTIKKTWNYYVVGKIKIKIGIQEILEEEIEK